ncbi:MAG: hypothetical protein ACLUE0_01090 [Bacteroides uniformis]
MKVPDIRLIQSRKKPCMGKTVRLHGDIGNGMPAAVQLALEGPGPVFHGGRGADGRPRSLQNNIPGQDEVLVPVGRATITAQRGQPLRAGNQVGDSGRRPRLQNRKPRGPEKRQKRSSETAPHKKGGTELAGKKQGKKTLHGIRDGNNTPHGHNRRYCPGWGDGPHESQVFHSAIYEERETCSKRHPLGLTDFTVYQPLYFIIVVGQRQIHLHGMPARLDKLSSGYVGIGLGSHRDYQVVISGAQPGSLRLRAGTYFKIQFVLVVTVNQAPTLVLPHLSSLGR